MPTNETVQNQGGEPSHFVVELPGAGGVHYVICQKVLVTAGGGDSLPPSVFEELLNRHPLRAAAIPGDPSGPGHSQWLAMVGQSGHGPVINVTINNND